MSEPGTAKLRSRYRVRDYMTAEPETLEINHSLLDAVLLLRRANLRHIPILENGKLVGVLTDRDVGRFAPTMLLPLGCLPVLENDCVVGIITKADMLRALHDLIAVLGSQLESKA